MKATVISFFVEAVGTIQKGQRKDRVNWRSKEERIVVIQTATVLRSARILRKVLETWTNMLSFRLQWKTTCWNQWQNLTKWVLQTSAKSIRLDTTGCEKWSTGNCARNWNLTILPNAQTRMRQIKFSVILRYKSLNPDQKTRPSNINKKENLPYSGLYLPSGLQSENQRNWKEKKGTSTLQERIKKV